MFAILLVETKIKQEVHDEYFSKIQTKNKQPFQEL